jgi:hypothetical protein
MDPVSLFLLPLSLNYILRLSSESSFTYAGPSQDSGALPEASTPVTQPERIEPFAGFGPFHTKAIYASETQTAGYRPEASPAPSSIILQHYHVELPPIPPPPPALFFQYPELPPIPPPPPHWNSEEFQTLASEELSIPLTFQPEIQVKTQSAQPAQPHPVSALPNTDSMDVDATTSSLEGTDFSYPEDKGAQDIVEPPSVSLTGVSPTRAPSYDSEYRLPFGPPPLAELPIAQPPPSPPPPEPKPVKRKTVKVKKRTIVQKPLHHRLVLETICDTTEALLEEIRNADTRFSERILKVVNITPDRSMNDDDDQWSIMCRFWLVVRQNEGRAWSMSPTMEREGVIHRLWAVEDELAGKDIWLRDGNDDAVRATVDVEVEVEEDVEVDEVETEQCSMDANVNDESTCPSSEAPAKEEREPKPIPESHATISPVSISSTSTCVEEDTTFLSQKAIPTGPRGGVKIRRPPPPPHRQQHDTAYYPQDQAPKPLPTGPRYQSTTSQQQTNHRQRSSGSQPSHLMLKSFGINEDPRHSRKRGSGSRSRRWGGSEK